MTETQTPENEATTTSSGGFTYAGTLVISLVLMIAAMAIDVIPNKKIDYVAPACLVAIALFMALKVRKSDLSSAVWSPVLVWFGALITVGQITRPTAGSTKERELVLIVHGLADHAWWILGATVLAAVVIAIRRFR